MNPVHGVRELGLDLVHVWFATARSALRCMLPAFVAAAVMAGCTAQPARRDLTVGRHRISIDLPDGWSVIDRGGVVVLKSGDAELRLADLGPVGPQGIRREVERARELWREGRDEFARWRMRTVPVPDALFATAEQRESFWSMWSLVSHETEHANRAAIDAAFDRILANTEALKQLDFDAIVASTLERTDPDHRRDVAARNPRIVDGRTAVVLDTWQRMSHTSRERQVFVLDDGYLLTLKTEPRSLARSAIAFERILRSLRFATDGRDSTARGSIAGADSAGARYSIGR